MKNTRITSSASISILMLLCHLGTNTLAFQSTPSFAPTRRSTTSSYSISKTSTHSTTSTTTTSSSLHMVNSVKAIGEGFDMMVELYNSADFLCEKERNVQVEILSDMAHFSIDLATFFSPHTLVLRSFVVVGRLCSILADYLPDHSMTIDETIFQSFMLVLSLKLFSASFLPYLSSCIHIYTHPHSHSNFNLNSSNASNTFTFNHSNVISFKDRRIYKQVFSPAGFTWIQFQTLAFNSNVLEWNEVPPFTTFEEEEDVLMLIYRGSLECYINGRLAQSYHKCSSCRSGSMIGDLSYAKRLTKKELSRQEQTQSSSVSSPPSLASNDTVSFQSGEDGAILLYIDTNKLTELIREDEELNQCVRNLVFGSIQDKLNRFVYE